MTFLTAWTRQWLEKKSQEIQKLSQTHPCLAFLLLLIGLPTGMISIVAGITAVISLSVSWLISWI